MADGGMLRENSETLRLDDNGTMAMDESNLASQGFGQTAGKQTANLPTGDMTTQWHWHAAYRDSLKNAYRSSYADFCANQEVCVKSDMCSGYGGHVARLKHDVLFRNTSFDKDLHERQKNPRRDTLPSFQRQLAGKPTMSEGGGHESKVPAHEYPSTRPPWAVTDPVLPLPGYKVKPTPKPAA